MTLDENQKQQIAQWIEEGLKLSEIQNRLVSEWDITLTYMEVRFLVDDLKLTPKDPDPPVAPDVAGQPPEPAQPTLPPAEKSPAPAAGMPEDSMSSGVSVTVDKLTKPGSLASGQVTFSDGNTAEWYLDQMGRLGLAPKQEGYRPSEADVKEFQVALEREITRAGL